MNLQEIINLSTTLRKIIELDLPFALSYKLTKLMNIVDTNEHYYNTQVRALLDKYAAREEDGSFKQYENGDIELIQETQVEFHQKLGELRQIEITDKLPTFKTAELETLSISPRDLYTLLPLIEE